MAQRSIFFVLTGSTRKPLATTRAVTFATHSLDHSALANLLAGEAWNYG